MSSDNIFNILVDMEYESSDENEYYNPCPSDTPIKLSEADVNILYNYFKNEGCNPITYWKIPRAHIYAALRRNKGDITATGKELEEIIQHSDFEIRVFYTLDRYREEIICEGTSGKPYLSGQDWQIEPRKGMYLLYANKIYQITDVSDYGCICLKHILSDRDIDSIYFNLKIVKDGKFTGPISEQELDSFLTKEYESLQNEYEIIDKESDKWFHNKWDCINTYTKEIQIQLTEHNRYCIPESKRDVLGECTGLHELTVEKIKDSICLHNANISEYEQEIENIRYELHRGYEPFNNFKYALEKAGHILRGTYQEWLSDYDYDFDY